MGDDWNPTDLAQVFNPLILQNHNLVNFIKGVVNSVVAGEEGCKTLRVIQAIQQSAETGQLIEL